MPRKAAVSDAPKVPLWSPGEGYRAAGFRRWQPETGDRLNGHYLGYLEITSKGPKGKGKNARQHDTFRSHQIAQIPTGELITVAGASLDRQLEGVQPHTEIWLVYNGQKMLDSGRRLNDYQVYVKEGQGKRGKAKRA